MSIPGSEGRFTGKTGGGDYQLFGLVVPHIKELQEIIAKEIRDHFQGYQKRQVEIVEIGTGTGDTLHEVIKVSPRLRVVTIDNEPKMITVAKDLLKEYEDRINYIESDVLEFLSTLKDDSCEGVFSGLTIHNFNPEYRDKLLKEIGRVVVSGGVYVNGDKIARDIEKSHKEDIDKYYRAFDRFESPEINRPDLKEEWIRHYKEDELIRFTESEQNKLLEENGFSSIEYVFRVWTDAIVTATKK